jgi:hypothetical protein
MGIRACLEIGDGPSVRTDMMVYVTKLIVTDYGMVITATISDLTGDIQAELHNDVVKVEGNNIKEGSIMFLQNVAVIVRVSIPYAVITTHNIRAVFRCNNEDGCFHRINELTIPDEQ